MSNWGVDSVSSHNWGMVRDMDWSSVHSMSHWSVDSVGNWVSYNWGSVGHNSGSNMWCKVSRVRDHSANTDGSMVSHIRDGGSSSQAKESRDDESLKTIHLKHQHFEGYASKTSSNFYQTLCI